MQQYRWRYLGNATIAKHSLPEEKKGSDEEQRMKSHKDTVTITDIQINQSTDRTGWSIECRVEK